MDKHYQFGPDARLRKKRDFQQVYATGRSFVDRAGILYVLPQAVPGKSRVGVAAGKKLGGAVVRNRLKRLMREAYRLCQCQLKNGFDLVWIARRPMLTADFALVRQVFHRLARRAGVFLEKEHSA